MSQSGQKAAEQSIGSTVFFDAKVKEFEASCYYGDEARIIKAEEDCRSALQGVLGSKRKQIKIAIEEARRNNR